MDKTISVIVPVYNVAAYAEQCIRSILGQDYPALEVLLVDDGSTDGSGAICDAFAAQDSRVRVLHQANAGAAAAKNAALRIASGEYLSFADSDDYLEPGAYRHMVQVLESAGADAVQFGFREVYTDRAEEHSPQPETLEGLDFLRRFAKDGTCALLWNKLYRRELYDGIFFPEGHKIDDEYFTYRGFLEPRRVVIDSRIVYNYRRRRSGVMSSPTSAERLVLDNLDATAGRRKEVREHCPALRREFDENYLDALWYLMENEGATARTVEALKAHIRAYFTTPGSSVPPRWLWGRLLSAYFTPTPKHLARAEEKRKSICTEGFYP